MISGNAMLACEGKRAELSSGWIQLHARQNGA